jgi:hypothetical protein
MGWIFSAPPRGVVNDREGRRFIGGICVALSAVYAAGCAAPFSEMQSARLAGPGVVEVTPSYSYTDLTDDGEVLKLQDTYAVHLATGLTDKVDLRLRLEHIRVGIDEDVEDLTATAIGVGPKVSLIRDRLALNLPVGFAFGDVEMSETWQFHPAVIWSVPFARPLELSTSVKALIPLTKSDNPEEDSEVLAALNIGLAIGPDISRWAIRPEVGFLRNPGESRTGRHFSIGAQFFLGWDR